MKKPINARSVAVGKRLAQHRATKIQYRERAKILNTALANRIKPVKGKYTPAQKARITRTWKELGHILTRPNQRYTAKNKKQVAATSGIKPGVAKLRSVPVPIAEAGKKKIRVRRGEVSFVPYLDADRLTPTVKILLFDRAAFGAAVAAGTVTEFLADFLAKVKNKNNRVFDLKLNHDGVIGIPSQGKKEELANNIEFFIDTYGEEAAGGAIIGVKIIDFPPNPKKETPQQRSKRYARETKGIAIIKKIKRK